MILLNIISGLIIFMGCNNSDTTVDKSKLLGTDYRLFQGTAAWKLAKDVDAGDVVGIKNEVSENKSLLSFREPVYGQSLLQLAVENRNFSSVQTLLALGANPNLQDLYRGESPLTASLKIGVSDLPNNETRFLVLLLKYGGDPNAEEKSSDKHGNYTPLMIACSSRNLEYVKLLIAAGANVNAVNEYGDMALKHALIAASPDIVLYLIAHGANYKQPLDKNIDGRSLYIIDCMRNWLFKLGSQDYREKMQIADFLKKNGMDYRSARIPERYFDDFPKSYLDKY